MQWAKARHLIEGDVACDNPMTRPERWRDRVLTLDGLPAIRPPTADASVFADIVPVRLLTGSRRSDAGGMTSDEIDSETWRLPHAPNKHGKGHQVNLAEPTLRILKRRRAQQAALG
jgi:integrase